MLSITALRAIHFIRKIYAPPNLHTIGMYADGILHWQGQHELSRTLLLLLGAVHAMHIARWVAVASSWKLQATESKET